MKRRLFCRISSILVMLLLIATACGCFSLGTEDMAEYIARFPQVQIAPWGLDSPKTISMSAMVGDDDFSSMDDAGDLKKQVEEDAYRMFWVNVADGNGKYPFSSVTEVAFYLACTGGAGKTVNYKIFKSTALPTVETFNLKDILDSESDNLYQDGQIIDNLPSDIEVLYSGDVVLKEGWTDVYVKLGQTVRLSYSERFVVYISDNNDSKVTVNRKPGRSETTENTGFPVYLKDESGALTAEQKKDEYDRPLYYKVLYEYRFSRYTENDLSFSIDKVLLYVKNKSSDS